MKNNKAKKIRQAILRENKALTKDEVIDHLQNRLNTEHSEKTYFEGKYEATMDCLHLVITKKEREKKGFMDGI